MNPEDVKNIKCDRCGVVVGLHRHENGWRCPQCIWNERENLIEWSKGLLNSYDYTHPDNTARQTVVVYRRDMDALKEVVDEVTKESAPAKHR